MQKGRKGIKESTIGKREEGQDEEWKTARKTEVGTEDGAGIEEVIEVWAIPFRL